MKANPLETIVHEAPVTDCADTRSDIVGKVRRWSVRTAKSTRERGVVHSVLVVVTVESHADGVRWQVWQPFEYRPVRVASRSGSRVTARLMADCHADGVATARALIAERGAEASVPRSAQPGISHQRNIEGDLTPA